MQTMIPIDAVATNVPQNFLTCAFPKKTQKIEKETLKKPIFA
jgi:hypothetical protein